MRTHTVVIATILLCMASHARAAPNNYDEAMRLAKTEVSAIRDFIKCFPQSLHFITHYTGEAGLTSWNGEAGLFGRYEVTLTIDITLDAKRLHVVKWGAATITINEVTKVTIDKGNQGVESVGVEYGLQKNIDADDWKKLVESKGDLAKVARSTAQHG